MFEQYPDHTADKLEFSQIRLLIKEYCISALGMEYFDQDHFLTDAEVISFKLGQVEEFRAIRDKNLHFPLQHYLDIRDNIRKLKIEGSVLSPAELFECSLVLETVSGIIAFFKRNGEDHPLLKTLNDHLYDPENEIDQVNFIFDQEGLITDRASPDLKHIRDKIKVHENQSERIFSKLLDKYRKQGWISDEEQSVRQGDRVISVQSKYKRNVDGIIVDLSSTGKSTYIQPNEIIQLRNRVFELQQEEKQEVFRICKEKTDLLRPLVDEFENYQQVLTDLDIIQAKERFMKKIGGNIPKVSSESKVQLNDAYHPLLLLKNKAKNTETIPLNLYLNHEDRILVVSGPNAGGKSVCLKTTGLLQLMVQSAIPVPADENSEFGIFEKIFVDIGDNQSIENDLSTYSSKLKNIKACIEGADESSLFLLDEFGAGTDPQLGGYIGEVVLQRLLDHGAKGIVTTHYSNLKTFADEKNGMFNGAMLFDTENLNPTYRLETGKPGSSYTFEIIRSLGFDEDFIREAQEKLGENSLSFDQLLIKLQQENKDVETLKSGLQESEKQLDRLIDENKKFRQEIKLRKEEIFRNSRLKADAYLDNFNKKFESLLKSWKEAEKGDKQVAQKRLKKNIEISREKLSKEVVKPEKEKKESGIEPTELKVGDIVKLKESSQIGSVAKISKNRIIVEFDHIKTEVDIQKLLKLDQQKAVKAKVRIMNKTQNTGFKPELDLRGKRREEAINLTEEFLDRALLFRITSLRIIHGYGDGILKKSIRELLKKYDFIKDFRAESAQYGGDGVTLVDLK